MLDDIVEGALYTEVRELKDGKKIVMDPETEKLYYRKTLSVFSVPVYRFLMKNSNAAIPRIKTFWQEEGNLVVIEDLIQGKTLETLLEEGKMSFEDKKKMLLEICDGLIFLHEAKPPIIHRDIKASNIMIADDGHAMIIDYDAAKQFVPGSEKDTVLIGTQGIAAPEQYGFAQSDQRTDIYAFGKLIEKVLPESQQALRIAEIATRFNPSARYKSVRDMKSDINRMWDPKVSRAEHNREIVKRVTGRKSFKIGLTAVIILIALLIGKKVFDRYIYPEYFVRRPAYEKAVKAMDEGDYERAEEYFAKCGLDYRDSRELNETCAEKLREQEQQRLREQYAADFEAAKKNYIENGGKNAIVTMMDLADKMTSEGMDGDHYKEVEDAVVERMDNIVSGETATGARSRFTTETVGFSKYPKIDWDSVTYRYADILIKYDLKEEAYNVFAGLGKYSDASDRKEKLIREVIDDYRADNKLEYAVDFAEKVVYSFSDWEERGKAMEEYSMPLYYEYAGQLMEEGEYKDAVDYYGKCYDYKDSASRINDARYMYCVAHADDPDSDFKSYIQLLKYKGYPGADELESRTSEYKFDISVEYRGTYQVGITYTVKNGYGSTGLYYSAYIYNDDGTNVVDNLYGSQSRLYSNMALPELYYHIDRIEVYETDTGKLLATWRR